MNPIILAFLVFLGVTGLVGAVSFLVVKGSGRGAAHERLDAIVGRSSRSRDSSSDLLIKQAMLEVSQANLIERLTPEFFRFGKMFEQADVKIKPSALFVGAVLLASAAGTITALLLSVFVAPVTALICFTLPFIWLWFKRNQRLKKFGAQLPEGMELVARALRAGHSLASGLHVVATEMPDPIAKEFGRVYEEQNLGISLEDALGGMCKRIPNLDLRFFVTSVNIQRQTGGDLAEILDRIGYVVRERFKILGQVKALTAEGRLSGIVLIAMPIGLFLMMLHMKPDYVSLLWTDPRGINMSIGAIVLMLIGSYAIKKIIDIKV